MEFRTLYLKHSDIFENDDFTYVPLNLSIAVVKFNNLNFFSIEPGEEPDSYNLNIEHNKNSEAMIAELQKYYKVDIEKYKKSTDVVIYSKLDEKFSKIVSNIYGDYNIDVCRFKSFEKSEYLKLCDCPFLILNKLLTDCNELVLYESDHTSVKSFKCNIGFTFGNSHDTDTNHLDISCYKESILVYATSEYVKLLLPELKYLAHYLGDLRDGGLTVVDSDFLEKLASDQKDDLYVSMFGNINLFGVLDICRTMMKKDSNLDISEIFVYVGDDITYVHNF